MLPKFLALGLVPFTAVAAAAAEPNISDCLAIEKSAPTPPPGLIQSIAAANTDSCTYTIPKSFSSAYASYTSAIESWAKANKDKISSACPHPTGVSYTGPAITALPTPTACKGSGGSGGASAGGSSNKGGASATSAGAGGAASGGASSGAAGSAGSQASGSAAAKSTSTAGAARETGLAMAVIAAAGFAVAAL